MAIDAILATNLLAAATADPQDRVGRLATSDNGVSIFKYIQADPGAAITLAGIPLFEAYSATGGGDGVVTGTGGPTVVQAITNPYAKAGMSLVAATAAYYCWIQIHGPLIVAAVGDGTGWAAGDILYPLAAAALSLADTDAKRLKAFGTATVAATTGNAAAGRFNVKWCM